MLEHWAKQYEHHMQALAELKNMKRNGVNQWLEKKVKDDTAPGSA
jgi:hypothetical protein